MSFENIPNEMQRRPQWVCWGENKAPVNPNLRIIGSPTNPKTWGSFDEAVEASSFFNGIGFCFTKDDPFVGIDFDHCITDGVTDDWVIDLLNELNTYAEYSPSGEGIHAILKAPVEIGKKSKTIECYSHGRYFTVTGNVYRDVKIREFTYDEFKKIITRYFKDWEKGKSAKASGKFDSSISPPAEMLTAFLANDRKFKSIWERSREIGDGTDSAYDGAVCYRALLAGWDEPNVLALLCAYRRKWGDSKNKLNRRDYFDRTILFYRNALKQEKSEKEALQSAQLEISKDGSTPEDILAEISSRLKMRIPIEGIIKRGRDPSEYYFQIEGQEFFIGEVDILITAREFKKRFVEITDIVIPSFKIVVWDHIFELMIRVQEYQDTGNRLEETFTAVREYLDSTTVFGSGEWKDALASYRPFEKDGKVWISIQGWQRSVDARRSITLATRRKLLNRLAQAKFEKRHFTGRISGKLIGRWYLGLETDQIYDSGAESEK